MLFKNKTQYVANNYQKEHDFKIFKDLILPHVFSNKKINESEELFENRNMREIDLIYLFHLYIHPDSTSEAVAKSFSKNIDYINRVYRRLENSKIKLVKRLRSSRKDFFVMCLTTEGKEIVMGNLSQIKHLLVEIKKVSKVDRGYKGTFYILDPRTNSKVSAINELVGYFNL